jgi:hypothetical protein
VRAWFVLLLTAVPYLNTKDVQIVLDGGDALIAGTECKDAVAADRVFRDAILTVD